jgi:phosphatidylethanolamine/phosphatidyl-N-methylethanolamine N-methyltransferase
MVEPRLRDGTLKPRGGKPGGRSFLDVRLADEARFIKSWIDNPLVAGAVSPSSKFLARVMARAVDPRARGPIIELGPGTGPVTQALIERGVPAERLILVEYDEKFCALLSDRFPGARVVQGDAYNLATTLKDTLREPPSAVVSSLPLLNKPEPLRLRLLEDALAMMEPNGVFVQFTYGMVSPIPLGRKGRRFRWFSAEASAPVLRNLPPARVWAYRRRGAAGRVFAPDAPPLLAKLKETRGKLEGEWRERAEKSRNDIAELKEKAARLGEELKGVSDRAQTGWREAVEKLEATEAELRADLRSAADKTQAGVLAGARKLLLEIEDRTRKLRDALEEKARSKP